MAAHKMTPNLLLWRQVASATSLKQLRLLLESIRYVGDLRQIAERHGLHYLKSKKMRRHEFVAWILKHHPLTTTPDPEPVSLDTSLFS